MAMMAEVVSRLASVTPWYACTLDARASCRFLLRFLLACVCPSNGSEVSFEHLRLILRQMLLWFPPR